MRGYSSPFASGSSPRGDAPNPEGVSKEASLSSKKDDESHGLKNDERI
jgi:hypothetical protein